MLQSSSILTLENKSLEIGLLAIEVSRTESWKPCNQFISAFEFCEEAFFRQKPARIDGGINRFWNMLNRQTIAATAEETRSVDDDVFEPLSGDIGNRGIWVLQVLHNARAEKHVWTLHKQALFHRIVEAKFIILEVGSSAGDIRRLFDDAPPQFPQR